MAINKQIKGSNLCETSCIEKKNVIHPETCVNQVLIDDSSEKTLREWILNAGEPATLGTYRCLKDWLLINYPVSGEPQDIPHADSTHYGVIKTGEGNQYLTLDNGVLTFNYSELPQLQKATYNNLGGIKLGNSGTVTGAFNHNQNYSSIPYPTGSFSNFYGFPLSLDVNDRAGVIIPQELFSGRVQSDWNTSDNTDSSYIRNKPSLAAVATSGSYNDLSNKPTIPAAQIQSDWNQTNTTALDYIKNKPTVNVFTGATSSTNGTSGLVPVPMAGQENFILRGNGEWESEKLYNFGYFMCDTHNYLNELEDRIYYILRNTKYQTTINVTLYSPVNVPNNNITEFLAIVDSYLMDQFVLRDETKIETMKRSYRFNFEFLTGSVTDDLEFELNDMRAPSFIICVGDLQFTTDSNQRGYLSTRCEDNKIHKLSIEYQLHLKATGVGIIDPSTSGIIRKYSLTKNDVTYTNHGILPTT